MTVPSYAVVIPTVGRSSLSALLRSLATARGPEPVEVIVVDDRRAGRGALRLPDVGLRVRVVGGTASGPAAARNRGWRAASAEWVAFLDDDVECPPDWREALSADLAGLPGEVGAVQGRVVVPLPPDRPPTDWERNVAGLASACWATADMAYRRRVLAEVGGFDERFPRAFREDADLGLRVTGAGYLIVRGERRITHPVRAADAWVSVRLQRGNADDALMRALHGPDWRERCGAGRPRNGRHVAATTSLLAALLAATTGLRRLAAGAGAAWAASTGELLATRLRGGPRDAREVATMVGTSAVIPVAATAHLVAGRLRSRRLLADAGRAPLGRTGPYRSSVRSHAGPVDHGWKPAAVLFDRDGTLVVDVPYNGDAGRVALMPGAVQAVARLRRAGVRLGVVSNQSGVGRGVLTMDQVHGVNAAADRMLGGIDVWEVCPHGPEDGCGCRKPAPGLIKQAAGRLGVDTGSCAVVGDIGADIDAAVAAGARPVLVPTPATRGEEVAAAPTVANGLLQAVDLILGGRV